MPGVPKPCRSGARYSNPFNHLFDCICVDSIQAQTLISHVTNECQYHPVQCLECEEVLPSIRTQHHAERSCPERLVECPHCAEPMSAAEWERSHQTQPDSSTP